MKKILFCLILLGTTTASFCQQTKPSPSLTSEAYLKQSKSQRTAATVLLIGGGALAATCIIIGASGNISFDTIIPLAVAGAVGGVAALGSIPLFILARKNKRKAMNASTYINLEKASFSQYQNIKFAMYPAISFRIDL